ncbi:MAG: hypothetical protein ACTS81_04210 [Arsenophonus sp. ER-BJ3-MAG3]
MVDIAMSSPGEPEHQAAQSMLCSKSESRFCQVACTSKLAKRTCGEKAPAGAF